MNKNKLPILKFASKYYPPNGSVIIVAVSGGPDSVALLYSLYGIAQTNDWELIVAHLDHQLRMVSYKDAEFVKILAKQLGLKSIITKKDVTKVAASKKFTIEEAARIVRYDFLRKAAKKYKSKIIALAHTADDQVETIVLNWLRGGLVRALSGMKEWDNGLWRPFLGTTKDELLNFLKVHNLDFRVDKSNNSLRYTRNKVRKQVLPVLKSINPGFKQVMLKNAKTFANLEVAIDEWIKTTVKQVVASKSKQMINFKKQNFLELPEYLQNELLLWAIAELKGDRQDIKGVHLSEIQKILRSKQKISWKQLPGKLFVTSAYDKISLSRIRPNRSK